MNNKQLTNKLHEEEYEEEDEEVIHYAGEEEVIHLTGTIEEYYRNKGEEYPLTPAIIAKQIVLFYNDFHADSKGCWNFKAITSEDIAVSYNYRDFKYDVISSVLKDDSKDEDIKRRFVEHFTEDSSRITETLIVLNIYIELYYEAIKTKITRIERYIPIYLNEDFSAYSKKDRYIMNTRQKGEEGKWLIMRLWIEL